MVGSPFEQSGKKNQNYTSPSFVSNAIFYEHSPNLSLSKKDMYTTTNRLNQSKSVGRLNEGLHFQSFQGANSPIRPMRNNNHHRTNMTTIDNDMCKNINEIYREKFGMRSMSTMKSSRPKTPQSKAPQTKTPQKQTLDNRVTLENDNMAVAKSDTKHMNENAHSRNQKLERCVTAPTLHTLDNGSEDRKQTNTKRDEAPQQKPPRVPCRQRSDC